MAVCMHECGISVCKLVPKHILKPVKNLSLNVLIDCFLFSEAPRTYSYQDAVIFIPHENQAHFGSHFHIHAASLSHDSRLAVRQLNPGEKKHQRC